MTIPLSLLDGASISTDSTVAGALARTVALAQAAERLGYRRFWVVEHHSLPSVASSAPAVLIAHLATATSRIRLGSGGVMLPNHAPLVVAEQFGMLESLHPGRIDLGIGRGPGSDGLTQHALQRGVTGAADDFPRQLAELLAFFDGDWPAEHPYRSITAIPGEGARPEVWLLGSSDFGARLAGHLGISFAFAHHFSPANAVPAIEAYRASFRPSSTLAEPHVMLATNVVCAETEERARWLAGPSALAVLRMTSGRAAPLPTPEEAAAHRYTPAEQAFVDGWTATHLVGDPTAVRAGLAELVRRTGADELMLAGTPAVGAVRSLELVAEAWGSIAATAT